MKPDPARAAEFLRHILEAISRISAYTAEMNAAEFAEEPSRAGRGDPQYSEIMGEAAKTLKQLTQDSPQNIPACRCGEYLPDAATASLHGYFSSTFSLVLECGHRRNSGHSARKIEAILNDPLNRA